MLDYGCRGRDRVRAGRRRDSYRRPAARGKPKSVSARRASQATRRDASSTDSTARFRRPRPGPPRAAPVDRVPKDRDRAARRDARSPYRPPAANRRARRARGGCPARSPSRRFVFRRKVAHDRGLKSLAGLAPPTAPELQSSPSSTSLAERRSAPPSRDRRARRLRLKGARRERRPEHPDQDPLRDCPTGPAPQSRRSSRGRRGRRSRASRGSRSAPRPPRSQRPRPSLSRSRPPRSVDDRGVGPGRERREHRRIRAARHKRKRPRPRRRGHVTAAPDQLSFSVIIGGAGENPQHRIRERISHPEGAQRRTGRAQQNRLRFGAPRTTNPAMRTFSPVPTKRPRGDVGSTSRRQPASASASDTPPPQMPSARSSARCWIPPRDPRPRPAGRSPAQAQSRLDWRNSRARCPAGKP